MGLFDSIKEWTPEKTEKAEPTTEQKTFTNELLGALGYGPHFTIEAPPPAVTPPTTKTETAPVETTEANEAEAAERASIREELETLRSALDMEKRRLAREAPAAGSREREPELRTAQSKSDLLAALRPILADEAAKRRADKDARRALRRLGSGR